MKLSACVIAQNEERVIERCLASLSFADEIIVVDGGSTDRTVAIAAGHPRTRVVAQAFAGFTAQRNRALGEAKGHWVFFLDADEEASPELAERLKAIAAEDPGKHPHCYSIRREEYFLGRHLTAGPGNPSHQWRFFKRENVRFEGGVHEYPRFEGPVGLIEAPIHHWPGLGIDKFIAKMNHYTSLEALDRFSQGQRTTLTHAVLTFFSTFLKNGIRYGGFYNGREGFILVLLESISRVVRHLKLWLLWQVHDGGIKMDLGMKLPQPGSRKAPAAAELDKPTWEKQ